MSFFATLVLVFVVIFRPQEIWPQLEALRLLDVATALAAIGVVVGCAMGSKQRQRHSPQLPFLVAFLACSYVSTAVALGRDGLGPATARSAIAAAAMLVVTYGARSHARLRGLTTLVAALAVFLATVAIHQAHVEPTCIELPVTAGELVEAEQGTSDGRSCVTARDCLEGGLDDVDYACERSGLFHTVSTEGRVRWRGQLGDPNELAVFLGAVIPLFLALSARRSTNAATFFALVMVGLALYAIILTQSRGGQLVVGAVFAIYFVSRFGARGLAAAAVVALPVIVLGGRGGSRAEASTEERLSLLYDAISELMHRPVLGIGIDQFAESARQTAHNAYLLAAVELGVPGMFAWTGMLWMSVKIPLAVVRKPPSALDAELRRLATAIIVSWVGMAIGIFFLSFTYKQLLFVWFGMSGALHGAVVREHPTFEVPIERKDYLGIAALDGVLLVLLYVYTRMNPV